MTWRQNHPDSVLLHLYNGAPTREAWDENSPHYIDDWKPEERKLICHSVQVAYGSTLRIIDGRDGNDIALDDADLFLNFDDDGLIHFEGVYYGDFSIEAVPNSDQL